MALLDLRAGHALYGELADDLVILSALLDVPESTTP